MFMQPVGQMPLPKKLSSTRNVAQVEEMLEEWFGSPVVLTSSGRGALMLAFSHLGLNRYRDRVAMTPMISTCVLQTVAHHAFPVDAASTVKADATLVYHQYGFVQSINPTGPVVEDICHAFFAGPTNGRRAWLGELAAFSLPKFFSTSNPVGGLVVHDRKEAEILRTRRDAEPQRSIEQEDEESCVYCASGNRATLAMARLYLSRLLNPRISDRELGALPKDVSEITDRGRQRSEIVDIYCDAVGDHCCPKGWHEMMRQRLPYFFPVGGDESRLLNVRSRLREIGVEADVYSIDVARNMDCPKFVKMLLVPCHDAIPAKALTDISSTLKRFKSSSSVMA
jgi:hypothetical protein